MAWKPLLTSPSDRTHRSHPCSVGTPHQTFERLTSDLLNVTPASRGSCSAMHKIANAIIALHKMSHHSCVAQIALQVFPELTEATSEGKNVQKLDANYS